LARETATIWFAEMEETIVIDDKYAVVSAKLEKRTACLLISKD